jgi:hypothetical protein
MGFHFNNKLKSVMLAAVFLLSILAPAAPANPATFVLTVSLPAPTMHVGDDLVLDVITTNPTDHVVYAGEGVGAGLLVELLNEKGDDIGLRAMGAPGGKIPQHGGTLSNTRKAFRPGSKDHFTWRFKPELGYVVPGVYRLRGSTNAI